MSTKTNLKVFAVAMALTGMSSLATADSKDVSLEQLPAKAKATIDKQIGDGKLDEIEQEMRMNQTVFEVEFTDAKGAKFEIVVAENGKLLDKRAEGMDKDKAKSTKESRNIPSDTEPSDVPSDLPSDSDAN
jgi:hypothetical protein